MEAKIAAVAVNDERVKLLITMPGLGYFSASLLIAEICDIKRFSSDKKLVSLAGLAPGIHQSGEKSDGGRITKQGNKLVRWVLVEAAKNACRYDDGFNEFYERYSRRKNGKKTVVAVAYEMLLIVWFMLRRNEAYRGGGSGLSERKLTRLERDGRVGLQV